MTPEQRQLARHALGLDGRRSESYRNHFVTGESSDDHAVWKSLVDSGLARSKNYGELSGGDDVFWLTRAGAEQALEPGEMLDAEDFPANHS